MVVEAAAAVGEHAVDRRRRRRILLIAAAAHSALDDPPERRQRQTRDPDGADHPFPLQLQQGRNRLVDDGAQIGGELDVVALHEVDPIDFKPPHGLAHRRDDAGAAKVEDARFPIPASAVPPHLGRQDERVPREPGKPPGQDGLGLGVAVVGAGVEEVDAGGMGGDDGVRALFGGDGLGFLCVCFHFFFGLLEEKKETKKRSLCVCLQRKKERCREGRSLTARKEKQKREEEELEKNEERKN